MKFRGTKTSLVALLTGALLFTACTSEDPQSTPEPQNTGEASTDATPGGDESANGEGSTQESGGEVADGENAEDCLQDVGITETKDGEASFTTGSGNWNAYNSTKSNTYSTYNYAVTDLLFDGFVYFGAKGSICWNKDFGTVETVSEDPLQVKYTINEEAKWSDGTPVSINDYLLDYAAQNPEWLVGEGGEPVFQHVSASYPDYAPEGPQGEVGAKEFTIDFPEQYPDWKIMVGGTLPAHIVAEQAGMKPEELAQAILDKDAEKVKKAAKFWNDGWVFEGTLPELKLMPSSGPYKVKENGLGDGYITLTANENYGGTPAGIKDITVRFMEDAAMAQALTNGDVTLIRPQATVDTKQQLENAGNATVESNDLLTWEHLDFNFRPKGTVELYDDEGEPTGETQEYAGSVFSDEQGGLALREAFAYCVPRQGIVDSLIKPINPEAQVLNAREQLPSQAGYEDVVAAAYSGEYDQPDIEKAKQKIEESGVSTPVKVRIGYRAGNQRRTETVAAIKASCDQAGFQIEDAASGTFFEKEQPQGDYEVALFAWAASGQIASGENIYATDKAQNFGKYSNPKIDEAYKVLGTSLDPQVHLEQYKAIDKELWDTLYSIPLYAHPGLVAYDPKLQNVRLTSGQDGPSWNAEQWVME